MRAQAGYQSGVETEHSSDAIEDTFRKAVGALKDVEIPFLVAGSFASWARGGPQTRHDLDLMVRPEDAEAAVTALEQVGLRREDPPENWLIKAWDGEVLVDVIFHPRGVEIDDGAFQRGERMELLSMEVDVISLEDLLVSKLLVLDDHTLDLEPVLQIARAVREQVDWPQVRTRTASSPYATAFFTLLEQLGVIGPGEEHAAARSRVRLLE